ncbi:MAG TPA: diaminopimelate epimerase [Acetobacteraceae bacterium]|nr:diaminopimelate epimerase [Acetobacteraceae bacterium]
MHAPFVKMHGCGNDFVIFDERARPLGFSPARVASLADRRRGIGCDQFITLESPPPGSNVDAFMRIRNPDGSESGACGNATRCVADLLFRETGQRRLAIATRAGILPAEILEGDIVRVDMGPPRLGWQDIPLAREMDTRHLDLPGDPAGASMGNPHATFFVADLDAIGIAALGPRFETDPLFPERANIGFAQVLAPDRIRLRVFERGAGLTLACGSGACATLVNAHRRGLAARRATLLLDGGELVIEWRESDSHVLMTGPAATAFTGQVDLAAYPA